MKTYKIVRFYQVSGRRPRVIKTGLTEAQAKAHCEDPKTSKPGKWFDGYQQE